MSNVVDVRWRQGSRLKANPAKAYKFVEKIRSANGGVISPEQLVEASRPKTAPTHRDIEWNAEAGLREWQLYQARTILRSFEVTFEEAPARTTRAYETRVTVDSRTEKAATMYQSIDELLSDPAERDVLLSRAIRDAAAFRRKYAVLSELSQVFVAIDELVQQAKA